MAKKIKKATLLFEAAKSARKGFKHLRKANTGSRGFRKAAKIGKAVFDEFRGSNPWELGGRAQGAIEGAAGNFSGRSPKPRVTRSSGRPSSVEQSVVTGLVATAALMKKWIIDNDRIATGRALNSIRVIIRKPDNIIRERYGAVSGAIVGSPQVKWALEGRGAGGMPPPAVIWEWMKTRGIEPNEGNSRDAAFSIARAIAAKGTLPPHFNEQVRTTITKVQARKIGADIARPFAKNVTRKWLRRIATGVAAAQGERVNINIKPGGFVWKKGDIASRSEDIYQK